MRTIDLDASTWRNVLDCIDALKAALKSPDWHGSSIDAFLDSIVWGEINEVKPPYVIRIHSLAPDLEETREFILTLRQCIVEDRNEHVQRRGTDVPVAVELIESEAPQIPS